VPTGMLEGVGVSPTLPMLDQPIDPKVVATLEGTGMFSQVKPLVFEVGLGASVRWWVNPR
jgi:hypothetical protein